MKNTLLIIALFIGLGNVNAQSKFNIDKVLKSKDKEMVINEIDSFLIKKSDYGRNIKKLNSSQKTFFLVTELERALYVSSLHDSYDFCSEVFNDITVEALLKIKAKKIAKILTKVNAEFKNGKVTKINQSQEKYYLVEGKTKENLNKYRSKYFEKHKKLNKLLLKFVTKNKTEFKE
jgi:hypothetical protein